MSSSDPQPIFRETGDEDPQVTEIESLCMNCQANGSTRLLLTRIPYYKNVVIMSFSCEHCGYENNEVQPGGAMADLGVRWKLRVESPADLDRQVVKSDHTSVKIPEVDFEIPAQSQKGEVTTVEGILQRAIAALVQDQPARKVHHPKEAVQIDQFLDKLTALKNMTSGAFTLEIEDISGNTFVENPAAPRKDPRCTRTDFKRTKEEDHMLGVFTHDEVENTSGLLKDSHPSEMTYEQLSSDEVLNFRTNCPECNAPADTNMKLTAIPHFKQVVIMATTCDSCGHRTNEVKSGGGVEERGVKFEVRVRRREDFSRDVLKSETCSLSIPELELEVGGRALGGRFTTAEGVLQATMQQLRDSPGMTGDAAGAAGSERMLQFLSKLEEVLACKREVTLVLDDPAGNSYVQSLSEDCNAPDEDLKITHYERSYEQNEELGLNDMMTEGYEKCTL